jgi:hypothetical protein
MEAHPMATKRPTTVFIAPAQRRALARLQKRLDRPMGSLIREAIALLLAQHDGKGVRRG